MEDLSKESLTAAPPPPPEVKIRTMHSDLASIARSGGGLPQFERVKVSGLSAVDTTSVGDTAKSESRSNLLLIIVAVIVLIALCVVGWLLYQKFIANAAVPSQPSQTQAPSSTQSGRVAVPSTNP